MLDSFIIKENYLYIYFTILDLDSQEGYCYMWPEINGKHEACEVASC